MKIVNLMPIAFMVLLLFVAAGMAAETTTGTSGGPSPLGKDWQCYKFPGDVELHRRLDKEGWLSSEKRVEAGKTIYENVFHPDGTLHVEDLYHDGVLDRSVRHPAPEEVSGGTYKRGQIKSIDFYKNNAVSLERHFGRDGSYEDREYRDGRFHSRTQYTAGGTMLSRIIVRENRIEYFYDDGKLKEVLQLGGDKHESTYYDRQGKVTTKDAVLRYDATLRFEKDNEAEESCGLAVTVTPTRQNCVLGEEIDLLVQVTCLAQHGVTILAKGEDGRPAEWSLSYRQRTGFGCGIGTAFVPEGMAAKERFDLQPGQILSQRVKFKPWGPVYAMMPDKAYPGLLAIQAVLYCRLADGKTLASPKSPLIYVVAEEPPP